MQTANLPLSWAGLDQSLSHRREGRRKKESFSLFFVIYLFILLFKASSIWRIYLLFCLALGVKGLTAVEAGDRRLIALPLDSLGRFCPVVSVSLLSLLHPGPKTSVSLRPGKAQFSYGQGQVLPIRDPSDCPYETSSLFTNVGFFL